VFAASISPMPVSVNTPVPGDSPPPQGYGMHTFRFKGIYFWIFNYIRSS